MFVALTDTYGAPVYVHIENILYVRSLLKNGNSPEGTAIHIRALNQNGHPCFVKVSQSPEEVIDRCNQVGRRVGNNTSPREQYA